ncbi:hypothetical protein [uncultured Dokdonia sp.]|uniref:hypothetical protein n=1 Tax=uncultured Dokdonia sp. TaxID=575653 RepID=UPI0026137A38|nr:hypothetical protein [uncultured Dokdonia sp.]
MKFIITTVLFSLLITIPVSAQSLTNMSKETTIKEYNYNNNEKIITIKTIESQTQNLELQETDSEKVNQHPEKTSIIITKEILIDNDEDIFYDKKVTISYAKDENVEKNINYTNTPDGIIINTSKTLENPIFLTDIGTYKVYDTKIKIENLNTAK